ncbi:MAG TPA: DoxX family membrane protein [Candidatus Paceibacterota bacterium]|nr:DoxX family membrane protein [Candidatus Paceibacterota bacterium]
MLSIFPGLLVYTLAAPLILRLAAGSLFLFWSTRAFVLGKHTLADRLAEWNLPGMPALLALSAAEALVGILLLIGLYTQVAALAGALVAAKLAFLSRKEPFGPGNMTVYLLVALICLSLALTGPGFFAFDLPL